MGILENEFKHLIFSFLTRYDEGVIQLIYPSEIGGFVELNSYNIRHDKFEFYQTGIYIRDVRVSGRNDTDFFIPYGNCTLIFIKDGRIFKEE